MDQALINEDSQPPTFDADNSRQWSRAPLTTNNFVTAWWDASQIYGYDARSVQRVVRDPADGARLLMQPAPGAVGAERELGTLPIFSDEQPLNPRWQGQEATAFPDNCVPGFELSAQCIRA